jgi:hypothetical protein
MPKDPNFDRAASASDAAFQEERRMDHFFSGKRRVDAEKLAAHDLRKKMANEGRAKSKAHLKR